MPIRVRVELGLQLRHRTPGLLAAAGLIRVVNDKHLLLRSPLLMNMFQTNYVQDEQSGNICTFVENLSSNENTIDLP